MQPGQRRLFIYYRVDAADVGVAVAAVGRFQARLRAAHAGLQAHLLRRSDLPGSTAGSAAVTLMETYALDAPGGIDGRLQAEIESQAAQALTRLLRSDRHVEPFEPCA